MSDVNFDLNLSVEQFKKGAEEAKRATNDFAGNFNNQIKTSQIALGSFLGQFALDSVKAFGRGLSDMFWKAVDEAKEGEVSLNNMNVALKQSGIYSRAASEDLASYAEEMQKVSTYSDDAYQNSIALLASLTDLDNNGLKKTTSAAADLAATFGIDLNSATEILARAYNGNTTQLQRMGIEINKGKTNIDTFKNVLDALSKYAGAAAAQTNTFAGAIAVTSNAFNNQLEEAGKLITQNPQLIQAIKSSAEYFGILVKGVIKAAEVMVEFPKVTAGVIAAVGALSLALAPLAVELSPIIAISMGVIGAFALVGVAVAGVIKYWNELAHVWFTTRIIGEELGLSLVKLLNLMGAKIDTSAHEKSIENLKKKQQEYSLAIAEQTRLENEAANAKKKLAQETDNLANSGGKKPKPLSDDERKALEEQKKLNAISLANIQKYNQQRLLVEESTRQIDLAESQKFQLEKLKLQSENESLSLEQRASLRQQYVEQQAIWTQEDLKIQQDIQTQELNNLIAFEQDKINAITDANEKRRQKAELDAKVWYESEKLNRKKIQDQQVLDNKNTIELEKVKLQNKKESKLEEQAIEVSYLNSARGFLAAGMELAKKGSRERKVMAIADATIATYLAANQAMTTVPFPANFVAAASVIAGGLVNVHKITSTGNYTNGGIIPGGSSFASGDKLTAHVNSGEMILNKQQQAQLFAQANGEGGGGSVVAAIQALGDRIQNMEIKLFTNDSSIALATSRGMQDGVILGVSR